MSHESVVAVTVEAKTHDPRELRTRDQLHELIAQYDVTGLQWTDQVIVENWVVPHSHPVLTMNTRTAGDDLLAAYLHEQLHWWIETPPNLANAIDATRSTWQRVPDHSAGGAKDEYSTRVHLLLCNLEHHAVLALIGNDRAATVLHRQQADVVYPWIYTQVAQLGPALDTICTDHGLWPDRLLSS